MNTESLLKDFDERIKKEVKIEPKDWMPPDYRNMLIRQIGQHAHSKMAGMLPEATWITRAPTLRRKCIAIAKVQDEIGHALYLYGAAETLNITRGEMQQQLPDGGAEHDSICDYAALTWADVGAIGWLMDGAAMAIQAPLCRHLYGPYARSMARICREERFHQRQGYEILLTLCRGSKEQKTMAQEAVNRWWRRCLAMFVTDEGSGYTKQPADQEMKHPKYDDLLQQFVDICKPQADILGVHLPDPELKWNAQRGHYDFSRTGLDEFRNVAGDTSCEAEEIVMLKKAYPDGGWVREASSAYAEKQKKRGLSDQKKAGNPHENIQIQHQKRNLWNSLFGKSS